jgi:formate dehydrogenase
LDAAGARRRVRVGGLLTALPVPREVRTYCRICESACGLIATVHGDQLVGLAPDPEHPVSRGYACVKGTRFAEVHHHKDRVLRPRFRTETGWEEVDWATAMARIGDQLRALVDTHGPSAVGLYSGNAAGHSLGTVLGATALQRALGTPRHYACLTLDNAPMFVVTEEVFGNPLITATADYAGSDCVLLLGTDPLASQPSQAQSHPGGIRGLVQAAKTGALIVVDPRRSTTAKRATRHLAPKPGTDVAFLAYLVREVLAHKPPDPWLDPADVASLGDAVAAFELEATAEETGLSLEEIRAVRDALLAAERPLVWSGLGLLLGPEGTLGWWLTTALQAVLGGLDRPGGWRYQTGGVDLVGLASRIGLKGRDETLQGRSGHPAILGTLAAADIAADALDPGPDRLRALIVIGGNPLTALPDTAAARRALEALDLLVSVDLFTNATGRLAHAVLPASDWTARPDVAIHMAQQRPLPHLQLAPALVPPRGDAREDWDILLDIARAAGRPAFGSHVADRLIRWTGLRPTTIARAVVLGSGPLRWADIRGPAGSAGTTPGLRERGTDHPGGKPRLAVPEFLEALASRTPLHDGLRLVSSVRPADGMNSWLVRGRAAERSAPRAHVHPDDAKGLASGDVVELLGESGQAIELECFLDPSLRRGVVVIAYGGPRGPNQLVGTDHLEAFTGQPRSNGGRIELRRKSPSR